MNIKLNSIYKIACLLFFALVVLFTSCKEPIGLVDDDYYNPNAGASRELVFSHDSGLYPEPFSLTLTAAPGSTIYYSIDGSIPSSGKVGNGFVFEYSEPITVQDRNGQPNILATPENSERFYPIPGVPDWGEIQHVYIPSNDQVPKATVIRAIAIDTIGSHSNVLTKTYFIGDNLANYANHRIISLVSDPFNLVDEQYGIMVRSKENNYNFFMRGLDWEREAYFELFEGNESSRSIALTTGVGIRIRGNWSRMPGQKSFNIYFREEYGINNLRNYNLIPGAVRADGTPIQIYKSFMLRNGGNAVNDIKFFDSFIHDLLNDRTFTTRAAVPCIVYLNGEYWGSYILQERYSDNHTEYKYGVNRNNVISIETNAIDDGTAADLLLFNEMIENMSNSDMSIQANYDTFCMAFDIDNFIDYFAAQIYISNPDWPHNNFRLWRTRNTEPGNPYGDTKWRWQMYDTDWAMLGIDVFNEILNSQFNNHLNNRLFIALLANEDFCRQFVNTMMDLYNVNFYPDLVMPKLEYYEAVYRPLMDGYFFRWGGGSMSNFQNRINSIKTYITNIRPVMVNDYLPTYFGGYSGIANIGISADNLYDVTLSATGIHGALIKINTVTPNLASGSWTGKYYAGNPITVTASAPPSGYEFDGWTVIGGEAVTPSEQTTFVNFTRNVQITAKYKSIEYD